MKHLTFKTVYENAGVKYMPPPQDIRHQIDWSKVSVYLSASFLSKNQLAKDGPESVTPVVILALAPIHFKRHSKEIGFFPETGLSGTIWPALRLWMAQQEGYFEGYFSCNYLFLD